MAEVLNRTTLEYRASVHTPDYPIAEWIHQPDMSAVAGVPRRYWKLVGERPEPMDQTERDAVDADLDRQRRDSVRDQFSSDDVFRALARSIVQELNDIRSGVTPPMQPITMAQFRQRIRSNI